MGTGTFSNQLTHLAILAQGYADSFDLSFFLFPNVHTSPYDPRSRKQSHLWLYCGMSHSYTAPTKHYHCIDEVLLCFVTLLSLCSARESRATH